MRDGGYGKSVMMTVAVGDNGCLRQLRQTMMAAETNSTQDDRQGTRPGGNHRHRGR